MVSSVLLRVGFLMRRVLPVLLSLMAGMPSCSHLKLDRSIRMSEADWPTYGRNIGRSNMTVESVRPPLVIAWTNDVTGGFGNGSPVVVDNLLVVGTLRGEVHVFDVRTGDREGWLSFGDAIQGSPIVKGDIVYVAVSNSEESLVAYNLNTGKHLWAGRFGDIEVSPALANDRLYVGNVRGEFFCVAEADGEMVWEFAVPENKRMKGIRSSPAISDSTVIFGCEDGFLYGLNAENGGMRWRHQTGQPIVATPSVGAGVVYAADLGGTMKAIDIETGEALWKTNLGASVYAGIAIAGGHVLAVTSEGRLSSLDAGTGELHWRTDLGGIVNAAPVISGGYAYVGTLSKILYAVDVASGEIVFQEVLEGRVKTTPAVAFGKLFVATDDRLILAFSEKGAE